MVGMLCRVNPKGNILCLRGKISFSVAEGYRSRDNNNTGEKVTHNTISDIFISSRQSKKRRLYDENRKPKTDKEKIRQNVVTQRRTFQRTGP